MNKQSLAAGLLVITAYFTDTARAQQPEGPIELRNARAAYQQQIKVTTDPIKLRYAQTIETLKKTFGARGDVQGALTVQQEIDSLGLPQLPPLGVRDDAKLIIWNQNNGGKGDRGTHRINVVLRAGGKDVWRKNGIRMSWGKTKQEKEVLDIPSAAIDTIRIEVTESVNDRGGLAEVELLKDGKNIAQGCAATASAVWQNEGWCVASKVTDGKPDTFWLLPDKKEGWLEINSKDQN